MLLVPGHKAELYCLAAEEARELCVPIVTMGIGSLYERVEHEKTGYIAKSLTSGRSLVPWTICWHADWGRLTVDSVLKLI